MSIDIPREGPYQPVFDLASKIMVIKQNLITQTYDGPYLEPVILIDRSKVEEDFKELQLLLRECVQSITFRGATEKRSIISLINDITV